MSLIFTLIVFILIFGLGGMFFGGGRYQTEGFVLGAALLLVLVVLLITGNYGYGAMP